MSYPLQIRDHPIPGRRYATVGRGAFEDKIAKMRMREENYYKVWNNVVNYYDAMDVKTKSHSKWASNDFFVRSYQNYCERERARQAEANLELRRSKLKEKLQREDELYKMELSQLPAHCRARACRSDSDEYRLRQQRVESMRAQLEETQRRQEQERLEQARQRLEQHWRINNAVLRQVESERLTEGARQMWEQQIREKVEREQRQRDQEEAEEEERRRRWEEEERRLQEEEEARQRSLRQAQEVLDKQMEEIRERERAEAELRDQENELMVRHQQIEEAIARRQEAERRRRCRQISLFQAQQCNAKLRQRSAEVEEALKDEQDFLDALIASGDRDRLKLAEAAERAESKQLRQVLQKQLELEQQRRGQLELLFNEEAERLWRRREADWAREEQARRRLMEDVVASWRQQSEQRLQRCRADRQREAELREAAAARAEEQRRFVQQTEELRRQRQAELRDSWARQVEDKTRRRDAEIREEQSELRHQQEADQREMERLQQELSRMQFNARSFNQYRDHRQTRKLAW
ncbi:trichoplein keratin filament-binding protein-like [Amphibalanus amphitrite]|uniref:trichoplein keratin filament-binding protein-like n=1 Tax=Amphibalanus amphitrite TaxID=1232801 RepID=UPI001C9297B3|nr:trichoplein keratin filament-binding protein-like [Amphibalanus amphitrite]XP_043223584.1 trichoplein keratin filament-binding protein-like [Amphibalanus amphitrite]XP_043223585.1 trichoplein keratin filament-binding protein-like [Amphibalanus amphitrite]XP_043223586.1 trichoplein keratin filament-binding protein-like [Amphibalanus amphitrite]XP_043223587.1 trichoplein keratin filament-binding protein-like [Amphibalanus amphitrite]XP_043223588.1 trichoplein keratin filament-binding protein-